HQEEKEKVQQSNRNIVSHAIRLLFPAMVGSSLSTIVIFLPFALLSGLAGAFFRVLAATMVITLISSFLVSWLALPVIYDFFSKKKEREKTQETRKKKAGWIPFFIGNP